MAIHSGSRPTGNIPWAVFNADFPSAFTGGQWSVITNLDLSLDITILSLPSGGGLSILDIEYRIDGGSAVSLGARLSGVYNISGFDPDVEIDIELRTVTRKGTSDWSDVKTITIFGVQATGGTETVITQGGLFYRVHTFLTSGTFTVTQGGDVEYLVVAGGGGGGQTRGGGGGAGGYRSSVVGELSGEGSSAESKLSVTPQSYVITVGAGGAGSTSLFTPGANGENSSFGAIVSDGGGGGGSRDSTSSNKGDGVIGGSGGGGGGNFGIGADGTALQGFGGGDAEKVSNRPAGGGGGAGEEGSDAVNTVGGNGGDGLASTITGASVFRAGGGGGGAFSSDLAGNGGLGGGGAGATGSGNRGDNAVTNTGGGGGGGSGLSGEGGNGGSGIVIIRYTISEAEYLAEA
jgi:hypothetical protein